MNIIPAMRHTTIGAASQGELIVFKHADGSAKAVRGENIDTDAIRIIVLETTASEFGDPAPFWDVEDKETQCLALGADWTLELGLSPELGADISVAGTIAMDSQATTLRATVAPGSIGRHAIRFNLQTSTLSSGNLMRSAARFSQWRIWLTPESANKAGAEPFFSFDDDPQP